MKKVFAFFILLNYLLSGVSFAVEDELLRYLDKNLKVKENKYIPVKDSFVEDTLNENLKIKKQAKNLIVDDFAEKTLAKDLKINKKPQEIISDSLVLNIDKNATVKKSDFVSKISGENLYIKVTPRYYYTTRKGLKEGQRIDFVLADDFKFKNIVYKKGTPIKARVENINQNGIYGLPSEVVVGNFMLAENVKLEGELSKRGANRSVWVYPTVYTLCAFFGLGVLFIPIRGGHAKLKPNKIYQFEVY